MSCIAMTQTSSMRSTQGVHASGTNPFTRRTLICITRSVALFLSQFICKTANIYVTRTPLAEFGTVNHDLHRARRAPSAKFFSRSMVSRLESQIAALAQSICDKILATRGRQEPFDVNHAFSNLTVDIVSQACFGESFGLMEHPGFEVNFTVPTQAALRYQFIWKYFPFTRKLNKLLAW